MRSLAATHADFGSTAFHATVVDNCSTDVGRPALERACFELGVGFVESSWPAAASGVNTHGDVLRDFVLEAAGATHFLLVDADTACEAPETVWRMVQELDRNPRAWAVQARFRWAEGEWGRDASLDILAGSPLVVSVGVGAADTEALRLDTTNRRRCHPAFTLIGNTDVFRSVAETIGLSSAIILARGRSGGFYDTLGLASAVLATHGLRYCLSDVTIEHFFGVTHSDDGLGWKRDAVEQRLTTLRQQQTAGQR